MGKLYRVATRPSPLAVTQARMAVAYFSARIPDSEYEIVEFKTTGDRKLSWSLEEHGGKGLFTKELEDALLDGRADFAVHSAKDMPVDSPDGLSIPCFLPRDDARDVLISKEGTEVPALVATGSPRRRAQLKKFFPNAVWTEIRGNVETRLRKVAEGPADATMLSAAGLGRLGISSFPGLSFRPMKIPCCVPAVGQGAIAVQCRDSDAAFFSGFSDAPTALAVALEREFLKALDGGCQVAFGAHFDGEIFHFFHEKTGCQKLDFSAEKGDFNAMASRVRAVAEGLLA